jgi:hypothetical protein
VEIHLVIYKALGVLEYEVKVGVILIKKPSPLEMETGCRPEKPNLEERGS